MSISTRLDRLEQKIKLVPNANQKRIHELTDHQLVQLAEGKDIGIELVDVPQLDLSDQERKILNDLSDKMIAEYYERGEL